MWKRAASKGILQPWRMLASRPASSKSKADLSTAVNSMVLLSLKEHYLEVSNMKPPPELNPPSPFMVVKGSLENYGPMKGSLEDYSPVLTRTYGNEEINISLIHLPDIIPAAEDDEEDGTNQLFIHVDVSKPGQSESLLFLCGLYPEAVEIHGISMRAKSEDSGFVMVPTKHNGPMFEHLDDEMKDAFYDYIEERGITESLFPFLQAWLYVKDCQKLSVWFKTVASYISEKKEA